MSDELKDQQEYKEKEVEIGMANYWQRVLLGAFGGALMTGGLWFFSTVSSGDSKWIGIIPIAIGIFSIFYARNLR